MVDHVFLDANVLFSAAYRSDSGLLRLWQLRGIELIKSAYALSEAEFNLPQLEQRRRLAKLSQSMRVIPGLPANTTLSHEVHLPEKDKPILLAAIDAGTTHLLTGDVRDFGESYGRSSASVRILRPAAYLRHALPAADAQ